jgi:hypothetical protein
MKTIKHTLSALALSLAVIPATGSAAFLNNWYYDADGAGAGAATQIAEYWDIVGPSYVKNTFTSPTNFTFQEWGAFVSSSYDGGNPYPAGRQTTGLLSTNGVGSLSGGISFTSGLLNIFSDSLSNFGSTAGIYGANDGTNIATFTVTGGGGAIDPTGIPNGLITLMAKATYLAPGYFFDTNMVDLSTIVSSPGGLVFGFATTNASRVGNPTATVVNEIVGEFAGELAGYTNVPPSDFVISNNGQFRLNVPEPGSVALYGIGLLALGLATMKSKRNSKA